MLDNVRVESYGSMTTLASVAQASMKGPQLIVLTVYDPGVRIYEFLGCSVVFFVFAHFGVVCCVFFTLFFALQLHAHLDGPHRARSLVGSSRASLAIELERVCVRRLFVAAWRVTPVGTPRFAPA